MQGTVVAPMDIRKVRLLPQGATRETDNKPIRERTQLQTAQDERPGERILGVGESHLGL